MLPSAAASRGAVATRAAGGRATGQAGSDAAAEVATAANADGAMEDEDDDDVGERLGAGAGGSAGAAGAGGSAGAAAAPHAPATPAAPRPTWAQGSSSDPIALPAHVPELAFFFGAILFSEPVRRFAQRMQDAIVFEHDFPDGARVNVLEDLHITLVPSVFPRSRAAFVRDALVRAVQDSRCEPFQVRLVGTAAFGRSVIWAAPSFDPPRAPAAMQLTFLRRWFGQEARQRPPWTPHATLLKTKRLPGRAGKGEKPALAVDHGKYSRSFRSQPDADVRCLVTSVQLLISCGTPSYVRVGPPVPLFRRGE